MAERRMLPRKRRLFAQQPVVRLKRTSDEIHLPNLKQCSNLFPITSSDDAVNCLKALISPNGAEPDLTLVSLVLGAIEHAFTGPDVIRYDSTSCILLETKKFPSIRFDAIKTLYTKFHQHLKSQPPASAQSPPQNETSEQSPQSCKRSNIRVIADKIWILLARSYRKDRLRMQYLYSLLTEHKLDSFGVTSSVMAACQLLGLKEVNMVLSEDHSWIEFGDAGDRETMEVTWHGKCTEDRRGLNVDASQNKWIYSADSPIRCTPRMAAAVLATQLNPCVDGECKSLKLVSVKRELLWFLHAEGLLDKLPLSLIELAKLETLKGSPLLASPGATEPMDSECPDDRNIGDLRLLKEAVNANRKCYSNRLVYPYLQLGEYFYKANDSGRAFKHWANAADVISHYKYGKEDEEVYKRFYEVANEFIPDLLKRSLSSERSLPDDALQGQANTKSQSQGTAVKHCSDLRRVEGKVAERAVFCLPLWQSPAGFANFLRFYDGICCWEEDSQTPVLHVTWAQHMCLSLLKFNAHVRVNFVTIKCTDGDSSGDDTDEAEASNVANGSEFPDRVDDSKKKVEPSGEDVERSVAIPATTEKEFVPPEKASHLKRTSPEVCPKPLKACNTHKPPGNAMGRKRGLVEEVEEFSKNKDRDLANNENCKYSTRLDDRNLNTFEGFKREISKQFGAVSRRSETLNPILEVLSKNCSNSIFNPEFFQGRGEPFLNPPTTKNDDDRPGSKVERAAGDAQNQKVLSGSTLEETRERVKSNGDVLPDDLGGRPPCANENVQTSDKLLSQAASLENQKQVVVQLKSSKMKILRDLLSLERLNTQAIKLQLTAQSNTIFKNKVPLSKQHGSMSSAGCHGDKSGEREVPERHASANSCLTASSDGESKVTRRVLRNRIAK